VINNPLLFKNVKYSSHIQRSGITRLSSLFREKESFIQNDPAFPVLALLAGEHDRFKGAFRGVKIKKPYSSIHYNINLSKSCNNKSIIIQKPLFFKSFGKIIEFWRDRL
jgi:hypothetical protein